MTANALVFESTPPNQTWVGPSQFNFISLTGEAPGNFDATLEAITRPGYDGTALRMMSRNAHPFAMESVAAESSATNAAALINHYRLATGCLFTLYDGAGNYWNHAVPLQVVPQSIRKVYQGNIPMWLVVCRWEFILTGTAWPSP